MRPVLERYVRSLPERTDHPHRMQDLGAFVCWLLPRLGFQLHLASFKYSGVDRAVNKGRIQWGVDIIASKPDDDDVDRAYLFVLKQGNIGNAQWVPSEEGSMPHDLALAAGRAPSDDTRHAPGLPFEWKRRTVVAVHNGDVDTEAIGAQVEQFRKGLKRYAGDVDLDTDWWDARRLVDLALTTPQPDSGHRLDDRADASIFPPLVQPFARLALDSLQKPDGVRSFDYGVLDLLIESWLPLGRTPGPDGRLSAGEALGGAAIYVTVTEMALFAHMLEVECRRVGQRNTLPVLETLLRIQCRVIEHLRRVPSTKISKERRRLRDTLALITEQFVAQATLLLDRLESVAGAPNGLAVLPASGERVSFPMRALRLCGYVAVAGLAVEGPQARSLAERLHKVALANPGGVLFPVTDDQVIELGLVFELLLRAGLRAECAQLARSLVERLGQRRTEGLPLPGIRQLATWPPNELDIRILVAAHVLGAKVAPGFVDATSTILTLALYLGHRLATITEIPWQHMPHLQTCQPPQDAADEWYVRRLTRGTARTYLKEALDLPRLVTAIEAATQPLPATPAAQWDQPAVDRMAWLLWRTRPPFAVFMELVHPAPGGAATPPAAGT